MYRLFHDKLQKDSVETDEDGMIRLDDLEMLPQVQEAVMKVWSTISDEILEQAADIDGYWEDFYQMFGFCISGNVDYAADVDPDVRNFEFHRITEYLRRDCHEISRRCSTHDYPAGRKPADRFRRESEADRFSD